MQETIEKLQHLNDKKLIDVVKNYRQYGFSEGIRNAAIEILAERGLTREDLAFGGNLENHTYNLANESYIRFGKLSLRAFIFYCSMLLFKIFMFVAGIENTVLYLLYITILLSTIIFQFLAMDAQNRFYKIIKKEQEMQGIVSYVFLGMPLYLFSYFLYKRQMREEMKAIT